MPTLKQYFDTDFNHILNVAQPMNIQADDERFTIQARIHLDFDANVTFISVFIPACKKPLGICVHLLSDLEKLHAIGKGTVVQTHLPGESAMDSRSLIFSGRVFFYCETEIPDVKFSDLQKQAEVKGVFIQYRGSTYAMERTKLEKPIAFVAHDSRDKDEVARPIAYELAKLMCPVWFDEFSLKVGDRLRESIEKGIKECKKCILVLTPYFLSNPGWTKVEFNSIFTREILERENLVLPVWKDIKKEQVFDYSPTLADRVGVDWALGLEEVTRRLRRAIV
jgi:hypothetical protein